MTDTLLTRELANELFLYVDGDLLWRERPLHHFASEWHQKVFNSRQAGTVAGTRRGRYSAVNINTARVGNVRMRVHRVVFLMHHGYLPPEIDHIDGDKWNNRIENLRAATRGQNGANRKKGRNNKSGFKGVYFHVRTGKFNAEIRHKGRIVRLGAYASAEEAHKAYCAAANAMHGEFANHG